MTAPTLRNKALEYFSKARNELASQVDRMFAWLLAAEWIALICAAVWISPLTWSGRESAVHPHLWAALLAGPAFILPAITAAILFPSRQLTRHGIAVAQMLVSTLLIDVTGGRIESHFHIFGSLAFLAFYRDWRVLLTASALTAGDHLVRGVWYPESVYGALSVSPWRWVEHAAWVIFEDFFLILSVRRSTEEMWSVAETRSQLYAGAYHDVLTGVANRRLLNESFESATANTGRTKRALLFLDLDRFKQANDTLGHTVGDKLLMQVSARLAKATQPGDTLARIGGDEFVVLLNRTAERDAALAYATRFLDALSAPFLIEGHELLLSASVGVSLYPEHGTDLATLQERADRAMYIAKSRGRNQCAVFSSEVARREEILKELASDLGKALSRNEFRLHFQPLIGSNGHLSGFEALLRWTHPVHGSVPPSDFIPLAEKSGAIVGIGEWVLREACRNCVAWQQYSGTPLTVAVNVSALQFELADFPSTVIAVLRQHGMSPALLTLELTESVLLTNVSKAAAQLAALRNAGVRIALDDFGTGYSSLSYLASLPADTIKLDHRFINREFAGKSVVLSSVIEMAHRIGLQVVGEGVETRSQNDRLLAMKCDQMQGFYFSEPMPAESVDRFIHSHRPAELTAVPEFTDSLATIGA